MEKEIDLEEFACKIRKNIFAFLFETYELLDFWIRIFFQHLCFIISYLLEKYKIILLRSKMIISISLNNQFFRELIYKLRLFYIFLKFLISVKYSF